MNITFLIPFFAVFYLAAAALVCLSAVFTTAIVGIVLTILVRAIRAGKWPATAPASAPRPRRSPTAQRASYARWSSDWDEAPPADDRGGPPMPDEPEWLSNVDTLFDRFDPTNTQTNTNAA